MKDDNSWIRWVLAGGAAVVAITLLALLIGTVVPRGGGEVVGGVDVDQLEMACRISGGQHAMLCQRMLRVDAAIDEGRCTAARAQARPLLAVPDGEDLPARIRGYVQARLDARCAEKPASP